MATVNIINVTSILPFNVTGTLTTSFVDVIDVPADKLYKVNTILISNIDGTNAASVNVKMSRNNGTNYQNIANTVSVPAGSTLVVIDKNSSIYLDETDLLAISASANNDLEYVISGEILDDA